LLLLLLLFVVVVVVKEYNLSAVQLEKILEHFTGEQVE